MTELRNTEAEITRFRARLVSMALVVLLGFVLLAWRLYYLQVQRHADLLQQAESNRTAVVPIVPSRGEIFDRNGILLAANARIYTLEITRSRVKNLDETLDALGQLVEITARDKRRFKRLLGESRNFESLPIRLRLSDEEVARFAAQGWRFPGVEIKARFYRHYPLGETASHVIGYMGRINDHDLEALEESGRMANYRGTEAIGKLGIESSYEDTLHGRTGVEQIETSAGGHAVRLLQSQQAAQGQSVRLSIDIVLQKLVEDLYGKRRGALVAIDPRNGQVLAMVSKPTFDPNLFVGGIDQESWDALNNSPDKPLLNRALRGAYPPGSTYKPFMALAALEGNYRTATQIINDNGSWTLGGHTFRSGHALGAIDLRRALIHSSNVYFYQLANDMGVNAIHDFMAPLGFGQLTGIDIPGEVRGVLPSTEWKRNAYKRPAQQQWFPGETVSLGIGQGYNNFTMLQLASATATLAARGLKRQPHLVMATQADQAAPLALKPQPDAQPLGYRPENIGLVLEALTDVSQSGTARRIFADAPYLSGGKTGTAQAITIGQNSRYDARRLTEYQRDHSLYTAFAPADNPTIAVACIVENAGFGVAHAAPIVRRVLDYWLTGRYPNAQDIQAVQQGQVIAPSAPYRTASDILPAAAPPSP
jgi:penicillin-binding protein 2